MGRKEMKAIVRERIAKEKLTVVRPYTLVEIWVAYNGRQARFVGLAKQGPADPWNETMGENIARGRAVQNAARRLDREILLASSMTNTGTEEVLLSDDSAAAADQPRVEIVASEVGRAYKIGGGKPPTVTWETVDAGVNSAASAVPAEKRPWRERLNAAPQSAEVVA